MDLGLDLQLIWTHFYQIGITLALTLPVAWNRENRAHGAGLRTFPLVATASCAFMLVGMDVYDNAESEARVMYGIITGMGFIGGGAIVRHSNRVSGTATAAGIWNTGAIGVSVAYSRYEIAIVLSVIAFVIFQFADKLKQNDEELD